MRRYPDPVGYYVKLPEKYIGDHTRVVARSSWETIVFNFMEREKNIKRWSSEEIKIPYRNPFNQEQIKNYYPDVYFEMNGNQYLVEIKPFIQTQQPIRGKKRIKTFEREVATYCINKAKWEAAEKFCKNAGWKFSILTEKSPVLSGKI